MKQSLFFVALVLFVLGTGCGQGVEPFAALGDPLSGMGSLVLPVVPYSSAQIVDTLTFAPQNAYVPRTAYSIAVPASQTPVYAPGNGVVVQTNSSTPLGSVTIMHNPRLYTKISQITPIGVNINQYVFQNSTIIGQSPLNQQSVDLTVYLDGVPTCPIPWLTTAARQPIGSINMLCK